jgi:hypothetical protein
VTEDSRQAKAGLLAYRFVGARGTIRSFTALPVGVGLLSGKLQFGAVGTRAVAAESPG